MGYMYTTQYYSDVKTDGNNAGKNLEMILREVSETEKDKHRMLLSVGLHMDTNNVFTKEKQPPGLRKETHGYQKIGGGTGITNWFRSIYTP